MKICVGDAFLHLERSREFSKPRSTNQRKARDDCKPEFSIRSDHPVIDHTVENDAR